MQPKKVPSVPSVQNVQDPETRRVLQALIDGWNVRNGQTRDDGARFVTRDELEEMTGKAVTNIFAGRGGRDGAGMVNGIVGLFQDRVQAIIAEIVNSKLWKTLSARIDRLDGPGGKLERLGLTQTGMAQLIEQTDSKVEVIEGQLVSLDGTIAAVVDTKISEVTPNFATAQSVTDLQTTVNGVSTNASNALSIAQGVDGSIDASWTVKFDADGYVVGAGLGLEGKDGNYTSQFLVRADRFAVGSPTTPNLFPFIVDTKDGSSFIALNGQVYIGARTISEVAENASVPSVNYIGSFATAPVTTDLKKNAVYKNTTNGNSYILDTDGGAWSLWLEKGEDGAAGQGQVKAVAFIRSTAASVTAPTGGSFASPTPTTAGWSDGIPAGTTPLWQSTRVFTSDGLAPHQAAWTTPQKVANTSAVKYQFSIDNATWSDTASVDSIYMRTGTSADGGTSWTYSAGVKVKGEQGPQGLQGQQGFQGNPGTRGSVTAYASGSSWNNSTASSAIYTQTGTYYLVIGDTVTISNNSSYAETRYWSGTSWVSPGVIIDGNLLVSGTISGNKINGGTITGTTIQTAASGKRIVMSVLTNKLQAFNASGTSIVELGGNTGSVYATADAGAAAIYGAGGALNYGGYFTCSVTGNEYAAVRGEGLSNANGVRGGNSTSGYWGAIGTPSYAGYFSGPVYITGALYVDGVQITGGGGGSAGVSSFNSRTGAVSLTASDVTSALGSTYVQNASYASSAGNANTATTATTATASVNSDATKSVRSDTNNYNLRVGTDGNPTVYSGTGIGTVRWSGQYGWVSDRARKTNIQDTATSGLDVVRALRVVDYSWKQSDVLYDGKTHTGFIAQEVQSVAPDAVGEVNGSLMMNLGTLVPHLVKAIQELSAEVEPLKAQLQGGQP